MSTMRLLPDRLVTGATPARHRSARSSRRCKASNASASSVARTIRPTPGEDRHVARLWPLPLGPLLRTGEAFGEAVEPLINRQHLSIDQIEPLGDGREVGRRRAHRAGRKRDRGRAQPLEHVGRREPPDPVAFEQAIHRRFAHPHRFLRGRDQTPKIEEPGRGDVIGQPEHLRVETPQELPDAVAEPVALLFQVLRHARPFPQFDHHRIQRLQRAKAAWVGAQRIAQHLRVPAIILGASRREAVPEAIELLGRAAWD